MWAVSSGELRSCVSREVTGQQADFRWISCLDDNELRYLGAPWEEYRAEAVELGLHVMRYGAIDPEGTCSV